jgi:hypothetical protein
LTQERSLPRPFQPLSGEPAQETRPNLGHSKPAPLSKIIRAFKSFSARRINELRRQTGIPVWQRDLLTHGNCMAVETAPKAAKPAFAG